jgi:hypothetical protein
LLFNQIVPMRVPLSLACGAYDRTSALARGDIRPEGVDLTWLALPVEETFFRMTRYREFDAAEMSLSSYLISLEAGAPFVAIPAFVSRAFRHNGIYVGAASGGAAGGDRGERLAAALGLRRRGADPERDGPGLLDLRPGREYRDAAHVRPVLLRAGPDQAAASGGRTVRGGNPRGVRGLTGLIVGGGLA